MFCLPPSIGLGDAVEYALAIKAIEKSQQYKKVGISFVDRYKKIFIKYFDINNVYDYLISQNEIDSYEVIFHVTHEIEELVMQKYNRQDIEKLLTDFFSVPKHRSFKFFKTHDVNKISIFPISQSPIRSMPIDLLNYLISNLSINIKIEIILNSQSEISNIINKNIQKSSSISICDPANLNELLKIIENIEFGIFMDSGPLHVAKILNKKGILIVSSVHEEILLSNFTNIKFIKNEFMSPYCKGPCGLTNIFNYKNKIGCYERLKIHKANIMKLKNTKTLQRGGIKNEYKKFIEEPVQCLKKINYDKVLELVNNSIK